MPIVALPDGREVEFPEGASPDLIQGALRKDFPQFFGDPRTTRKAELQTQQAAAREEGVTTSFSARAGAGIEQGLRTPEVMLRGGLDALQYYRALDAVTGSGDKYQQQNQAAFKAFNERDAYLARETQAIEGREGRNFVGDLVQGVARGVVELPPQLMAGAAGVARGGAVKASAIMGGAQGGLTQFAQDRGEGRSQLEAMPNAVQSGLTTALITRAFGDSGVEAVFRNEGVQGFRRRMVSVLREAGMEGAEEFTDQLAQDTLERATRNPGKPLGDTFYDTMQALGVGVVIGGGVNAPRLLPQRGARNAERGTETLPDGREVIVNQETGTTEFAAPTGETSNPQLSTPNSQPTAAVFRGANGEDIRVDLGGATLEQAQAAIFRQNPGAEFVGTEAAPASQPSTPPLSTSPALRPEAAMETRPSAEMGLDRTQPSTLNPELSTDLADTIAALRAGYRPEVEQVAPAPEARGEKFDIEQWRRDVAAAVARPSAEAKPPAPTASAKPAPTQPLHLQNLRDKTGVLRDWILKRREADDKTASPTLKSWAQTFDRFEKLYAARPFAETLEQFAAKYAEDFDGVQMAQDFTPAQLDQVKQLLLRQSDVWLLNQPSGEMVKQNQQNPVSRALLSTLGVVQSAQKRGAVKSAPERIVATALRLPETGEILSSANKIHVQLWMDAGINPAKLNSAQIEAASGFLTSTGRFVGRDEASQIGAAQGMIAKGEDLMGENVAGRQKPIAAPPAEAKPPAPTASAKPAPEAGMEVVGTVKGVPPEDIKRAVMQSIMEGGAIEGMKRDGSKDGHYVVIPKDKLDPESQPMAIGPFKDKSSAATFLEAEVGAPGAKVVQVKAEKPAKPGNKKEPVLGSGMKMTEVRPGQWKFTYQGRSVKAMTDGRGISVRLFNGDTATATYALVESQAAAQQWAKEQLYGAPTPAAAKPAPDRIETLLDAAEAKLKGSGGLMEGVTGLPVWVTREAARGVIKVMRVAYLATRDIAAALRAGLDWLRNQNLKGFIEAEANEFITGLVRGEWGEGSMDGNKTDGLKLLDGELDLGFKSTPTVFEIAMGFQDRFGRAIDYTNLRPEDNGRLVASLVQEIKRAVKLHPEALGWYDENLNLAMDVMRDLDPDLAKPENNFIFKAILAATSDGNKVGPQFKQTWQEYSHWKKHHQIYGGFVSGDRGENIRANLSMLNELIAHAGWEQTRDFMVRKGTVAELRQALVDVYGWTKEQANKIGTAERIDERVPFAIVLGPKLGSFFANLYGDYSSVTMDRWFMRTIGRLTGTLAALLPEGKLREMRNRLRDAVSKLTPEQFSLLNIPRARLVGSGINDSATTISGRFAKKDLREVAQQLEESGQPALENVRLAANALKKGLRPMAEAPDNGTHRRWIRERVDEVQQILKADGIEMENADLQAVLWYLEKELYEKLKYRIKKGDNDYAAAANSVYEAIDGRQSPKYRRGLGRIRAIGDGSQAGVGGAAEGRAAPVRSQEQVDSADAADKTVRDYLGGTSANPFLDPKFWQAVAVSGARMLRDLGQFTVTQAKWSAAMLKQFGQRIQQALAATWNRLMRLQTQQTNGVSAIGQGHLNQIELASVNANIAEEQKPVYSEEDLAKGAPGLLVRLQPMSKQIAYLGGAALLADKQRRDVSGALQAAAVEKQSDALWQQLVESSASGNPLTKWKLPAWLIGSPRARAFKTRVLHIAARLNATGRDAAGNFTFADFTMRAGTMSLGTAKQSELSVGDEFTVNDPLTGVTETLTLGPMITTPEGRVFHQLARPVDGATQAELYQHFAREYPEMIWFLDMFIDPALAGLRQTINGIEVPVFNRFAAAAMMADGNPNFSPLTAYTPDVLVTRSLIGAISGAWHKSGVRSPGRKYKSGTSREGGHVRDLLSGFNVRTWQMLQEKSRREWMQAVLKSAKPIRQNQVPEGWVKLETGMEELWQAVKRLRNWKSPVYYQDATKKIELSSLEQVRSRLKYNEKLVDRDGTWFIEYTPFQETETRMTEKGAARLPAEMEYKHFFGEVAKLRGDQLMLPKTLVDQLVRKYVAHVEHGTLYRLGSWLVRNSTQLFLVAPVTVVNNVLTNDMFTLQAATRRILSGVAGGKMQDLRFARELFTAEFFKWFPGLRTLVDPQWRAAMNADVLPENLFADQTMLADLKVRLDEDPLTYLRQGEIGAAALNFIRYGNIDTRAKTRMAYAWLRAQAVTNARKAGLRGAALRASVDAYLANPPIADMASAVEVAGFELLNYADSPAWLEDMASGKFSAFGGTADVGDFGRLVMPFPRFGYHFMAKTAREASAVKLLLGKVPKSQRAAAFADLITFLIWPAGGLGILAAYGLKGLGDDDDEARKRVGTASIKTVDADGNVVSKPLPRELITSNRINLSAWARGVGIGTDREEDSWLRIRSYPTIATAGAALLAMEDARKFGFAEGAKTYLGAVKDLASDFFSVGWMVKVPAKVLNDLGNNRLERTVVDPYAAGVPTLAYVVDQTLDSFVPGTRQFDIAVKWLDPIARRRGASKTMGFEPTVWDAARVGHVTGLMDRLFAGADGTTASTLPPEGKIDRRTSSVPVPQEYSLQQRITELVGFNVRPIDRSRYEEALSPYATRN